MTPGQEQDKAVCDLGAARLRLGALSAACREGAISPDPRVTLLALALVARAGADLVEAA